MLQPVWYLAHPIKADEKYSTQQNLDHIVHLTKLFYECGIYVVAPYHTVMLALDDNNPEHRRMGMEANHAALIKLGRLLLVGHKFSEGMKGEFELIAKLRDGGDWMNLVGYSDEMLKGFCHRFNNRLIGY
jgi:hypothetical protein